MPTTTAPPDSQNIALRTRLRRELPLDSDFNAFVMDHFPDVYFLITNGMDRIAKENILISITETDHLHAHLDQHHSRPFIQVPQNHTAQAHHPIIHKANSYAWYLICVVIFLSLTMLGWWLYRTTMLPPATQEALHPSQLAAEPSPEKKKISDPLSGSGPQPAYKDQAPPSQHARPSRKHSNGQPTSQPERLRHSDTNSLLDDLNKGSPL